jgi:hypothetical protein
MGWNPFRENAKTPDEEGLKETLYEVGQTTATIVLIDGVEHNWVWTGNVWPGIYGIEDLQVRPSREKFESWLHKQVGCVEVTDALYVPWHRVLEIRVRHESYKQPMKKG